jgi:hypothetical protein
MLEGDGGVPSYQPLLDLEPLLELDGVVDE